MSLLHYAVSHGLRLISLKQAKHLPNIDINCHSKTDKILEQATKNELYAKIIKSKQHYLTLSTMHDFVFRLLRPSA